MLLHYFNRHINKEIGDIRKTRLCQMLLDRFHVCQQLIEEPVFLRVVCGNMNQEQSSIRNISLPEYFKSHE